jgi:hypothetical protein
MYLASVLLVAFMSMVMMTGCTKAGSASKGTNFGNYPADYRIAYVSSYGSMLGLPNTLSVRTLFGPDAYFITSFNGVPAVVTLESAEGTQKSFTAQLLLSVKASEGAGNEDVKIMRMQLTFESDSTSEMSYLRYVKVTNMQTGRITEERAYGDERSDAGLLAFFAGFWSEGLIWDVSKYSQ